MADKANSNLIVVGVLKGAHGVRGDVRVKSFTADPEACFAYGELLGEDGARMLTPRQYRAAKDHYVITPSRPRQKEEWDKLRGSLLYVPRDVFPETDEDEYYVTDLIGAEVYGGGEDMLGKVQAVQNYGADDLLEIQPKEGGKSVFVPFTRADVPTVDIQARRIVVADFQFWSAPPQPDEKQGDGA